MSNYDSIYFHLKTTTKIQVLQEEFSGIKSLPKQLNGTVGAEFQRISSQFHILDRINDVEFSRDFNLTQNLIKSLKID